MIKIVIRHSILSQKTIFLKFVLSLHCASWPVARFTLCSYRITPALFTLLRVHQLKGIRRRSMRSTHSRACVPDQRGARILLHVGKGLVPCSLEVESGYVMLLACPPPSTMTFVCLPNTLLVIDFNMLVAKGTYASALDAFAYLYTSSEFSANESS